MTGVQKFILSFLIAVVAFGAFAVWAFSGLFATIETSFFRQHVEESFSTQLNDTETHIKSYFEDSLHSDLALAGRDFVVDQFKVNPSASDIKSLADVYGDMSKNSGLTALRLFDTFGALHYSSRLSDVKTQSPTRIEYLPESELDSTVDLSALLLKPAQDPVRIIDPIGNQIILSVPVIDSNSIFYGTAVFYLSLKPLSDLNDRYARTAYGDHFKILDSETLLLNMPPQEPEGLAKAIMDGKAAGKKGERFKIQGDPSYYVYQKPVRAETLTLLYIVPAQELEFPLYMRILMLGMVFLTVFLLSYLLFNLRQDYVVLLSERIKRLQINVVEEFVNRKDSLDVERWQNELRNRREEVRATIKRGLGRRKKKNPEIDALIDKGWDEILEVLGHRKPVSGAAPIDLSRLEELVEKVIANYQQHVADLPLATQNRPVASTRKAPAKASKPPAPAENPVAVSAAENESELEELEELGTVDESANPASAQASELEEIAEVEELESLEEAASAEEDEAVSAGDAEDLEALEEVEEISDAEEISEAGDIAEAEAVSEAEDLESLEEAASAGDFEDAAIEAEAEAEELGEAADSALATDPAGLGPVASSVVPTEDTAELLEELEEFEELEELSENEVQESDPAVQTEHANAGPTVTDPNIPHYDDDIPSVFAYDLDSDTGWVEQIDTGGGPGSPQRRPASGAVELKEREKTELVEELDSGPVSDLEELGTAKGLGFFGAYFKSDYSTPRVKQSKAIEVLKGVDLLEELRIRSRGAAQIRLLRDIDNTEPGWTFDSDDSGVYKIPAEVFSRNKDTHSGKPLGQLLSSISKDNSPQSPQLGSIAGLMKFEANIDLPGFSKENEEEPPKAEVNPEKRTFYGTGTERAMGFVMGSHGLDLDHYFDAFRHDESGRIKAIYALSKRFKSEFALLIRIANDGFTILRSIGFSECGPKLQFVEGGECLVELNSQPAFVLFDPSEQLVNMLQSPCHELTLAKRAVLMPVSYEGENGYCLLGYTTNLDIDEFIRAYIKNLPAQVSR